MKRRSMQQCSVVQPSPTPRQLSFEAETTTVVELIKQTLKMHLTKTNLGAPIL